MMLGTAAISYKIRIISKFNGVGLSRDIELLSACLRRDGHEVSVHAIDADAASRRRSPLRQSLVKLQLALPRAAKPHDVDLNIMLEHIWSEFLPRARSNAVVPNPEWFDRNDLRFLRHVDRIWAKTGHSVKIFDGLDCATSFIGFDSEDRRLPGVPRERRFFHLAGKSTMKGTDRLVRAWAQRPDWPTLTVIQHAPDLHAPEIRAANIERRCGYLDEQELLQQQNACMFHLCPSLSEGWGHYIAEALSVGAVTLTVDAPPMNELVNSQRGLLIAYERTQQQRLATTYYFCQDSLQAAVERAIAMSDEEWSRLSANARGWFEANRLEFQRNVQRAVRELVESWKAPSGRGYIRT